MREFKVWCNNYKEWERHSVAVMPSGIVLQEIMLGRWIPCNPATHIAVFSIGMNDKKGRGIYEREILKGFGFTFMVKWGVVRRELTAPNGTTNILDIPSFYFERVDNPEIKVYPIVNNYKDQHDLEELEIIGNTFENPELWEETP